MNTTHLGGPTVPPPEPHPEIPSPSVKGQMLREYAQEHGIPTIEVTAAANHKLFTRLVIKAVLCAWIMGAGAGYYAGVNTKKVQFIERLHADPAQVVLL